MIKFFPRGTSVLLVFRRPRKSFALLIYRTLDTTHASMIASFIGRSTQKKPAVQCIMLLDTRRSERKLLRKLYGTFRSLPVYSGIS
jgi:hypothetical protein